MGQFLSRTIAPYFENWWGNYHAGDAIDRKLPTISTPLKKADDHHCHP